MAAPISAKRKAQSRREQRIARRDPKTPYTAMAALIPLLARGRPILSEVDGISKYPRCKKNARWYQGFKTD
jgi:hypothetical protein